MCLCNRLLLASVSLRVARSHVTTVTAQFASTTASKHLNQPWKYLFVCACLLFAEIFDSNRSAVSWMELLRMDMALHDVVNYIDSSADAFNRNYVLVMNNGGIGDTVRRKYEVLDQV